MPPTLIELYAVSTPQVARPTKVEIPLTCKLVDCNWFDVVIPDILRLVDCNWLIVETPVILKLVDIPWLIVATPVILIFLDVCSSYTISPVTFKSPLNVRSTPVHPAANSSADPPPIAVLAIPTHF